MSATSTDFMWHKLDAGSGRAVAEGPALSRLGLWPQDILLSGTVHRVT